MPFRFTPEPSPERESALYTPRRISIIAYFLQRPCSKVTSASKVLSIGPKTIRHHLNILSDEGIMEKLNGRYFVSGAIVPEHAEMFSVMDSQNVERILALIIQRGPLERADIMRATRLSDNQISYALRMMRESGIIRKKEGTYELAFDLVEFQYTYESLMEKTLARLAMDARAEGKSMEIIRKGHGFILRMKDPDTEFHIPEVPFYEILG